MHIRFDVTDWRDVGPKAFEDRAEISDAILRAAMQAANDAAERHNVVIAIRHENEND